eukprot:jgi/Tetstr1/463025/TSEL_007963.t1
MLGAITVMIMMPLSTNGEEKEDGDEGDDEDEDEEEGGHSSEPADSEEELASLAWRPQFTFLAINKPARFYLRELHDVLRTKDSWSGRVKMTHQLIRHDLEWWVAVPPNHSNNRSVYKPVKTAYMRVDSSGYG